MFGVLISDMKVLLINIPFEIHHLLTVSGESIIAIYSSMSFQSLHLFEIKNKKKDMRISKIYNLKKRAEPVGSPNHARVVEHSARVSASQWLLAIDSSMSFRYLK